MISMPRKALPAHDVDLPMREPRVGGEDESHCTMIDFYSLETRQLRSLSAIQLRMNHFVSASCFWIISAQIIE